MKILPCDTDGNFTVIVLHEGEEILRYQGYSESASDALGKAEDLRLQQIREQEEL